MCGKRINNKNVERRFTQLNQANAESLWLLAEYDRKDNNGDDGSAGQDRPNERLNIKNDEMDEGGAKISGGE